MSKTDAFKYNALNELAEQNGIVIFGGCGDLEIPLCELKQAFSLDQKLYNRSIDGLTVSHAISDYDTCVAALNPETILLHIGEADRSTFDSAPSSFDQNYRQLIAHIRSTNPKCRIAVISLKNPDNDSAIAEMNLHLKYIAESEHCEYGDITSKHVWNPKQTKDIMSFLSALGFARPRTCTHPVYDLVKILFCYETAFAS